MKKNKQFRYKIETILKEHFIKELIAARYCLRSFRNVEISLSYVKKKRL